ncbi:MAG: hypothetical protein R3264_11795, partial [Anaerolineae bacterium]|nr:hypothetical protein [Anaerolineae bacterium]
MMIHLSKSLQRICLLLFVVAAMAISPGTVATQPTTVVVDADTMALDGNVSSVANLLANKGSDGKISFREALLAVNNTGPGHTIKFNLPHGTRLFYNGTLFLTASHTTIDGDVSGNGKPDVLFASPDQFVWMQVSSDNNTFRNLAFISLELDGNGAHHNTVTDSYIGTDIDGVQARSDLGNGLVLDNGAHNNIIENNIVGGRRFTIISGQTVVGTGILIEDGSHDNIVRGNRIGVNVNGAAIPNGFGVGIEDGASNNTIGGNRSSVGCDNPCNVISSNDDGVGINNVNNPGLPTTGNLILGNYIGVSPDGQNSMPNTGAGVQIFDGATHNIIGGERSGVACDGPCNVISSNNGNGVLITGKDTVNNRVLGNYIGLSADGSKKLPNGKTESDGSVIDNLPAIMLSQGASQTIVGGERSGTSCDGPCNVISGNNATGIGIKGVYSDTQTINNQVLGNFIGVTPDGT